MAACSAAIVDTGRVQPLAEAFVAMERGHAEALAPMVSEVLKAAGLGPADLDRIAVTVGPGSFTGLRIGLAFARGLGMARGLPVVGIDSLSAIAANETAASPLLVAADARNGEVYAAAFDAARHLVSGPRLVAAGLAAEGLPETAMLIGTAAGDVRARSGRSDLMLSRAGDLPVAARFARLAAGARPGASPAPLYLRAPDAKPQPAAPARPAAINFEFAECMDEAVLAALHSEAFEQGWSAREFRELLAMPGAKAIIAHEAGVPQAFLLARQAADEAEIVTIATRPAARRLGIARQLLAFWMAQAAAQGVRQVFLEVAVTNSAALGLYAALGFAEAGRRKGYYRRGNTAQDAIVMRREAVP